MAAPKRPVVPVPDHAIEPFAGGTGQRLAQATLHFHAESDSAQPVGAGDLPLFRECQRGEDNRPAGVDDGLLMRIFEAVNTR